MMDLTPPDTLSPKQALFIREYASGLYKDPKAVAIAVGYDKGRAAITAKAILGREDAKAYYNAVTNKATEKAAEEIAYSKTRLANYYASILDAKPGSASENNPLCDTVVTKEGEVFTLPSKLAAAKGMAEVMGWNRPEDDGTTKLAGALTAILGKRDI